MLVKKSQVKKTGKIVSYPDKEFWVALKELVRISDRSHPAWDKVKSVINKMEIGS